ncbi:MAG TPA: hypothetical protein VGF45_14070 [Polyangia bacterium]
MSKVQIRQNRFRPSTQVLAAARRVANGEIAMFYRAAGMLMRPTEFPAPTDRQAPEYALMAKLARITSSQRSRLVARAQPFWTLSSASRELRYPGTGALDLKSSLSIRAQIQARLPKMTSAVPIAAPQFLMLPGLATGAMISSTAGAGSRFYNVFFRMKKLTCLQMTEKRFPESDPDSIDVSGVAVDWDGSIEQIATVHGGADFTSGVSHDYVPSQRLAAFAVPAVAPWPKTFTALLVMEERDDANPFGWAVDVLRLAKDAIARSSEIYDTMTASGSERSSEGWVGILRQVVQWIADELFAALGNDAFRAQAISVDIPDLQALGNAEATTTTLEFQDHGGHYTMEVEIPRVPNIDVAEPDRRIERLQIKIGTGSDDLRDASEAFAILRFQDGQEVLTSLNNRQGWGAGSRRQFSWQVPATPVRRVRDLRTFAIKFAPGRRGFPYIDTADNWDVTNVVVEYEGPDGNGTLVNTSTGIRFEEGALREWTHSLGARLAA